MAEATTEKEETMLTHEQSEHMAAFTSAFATSIADTVSPLDIERKISPAAALAQYGWANGVDSPA